MKRLLLLMFTIAISSLASFAQDDAGLPNDPAVNDDANACFEGGAMEGKCNQDFDGNGTVDDYEVAWAWECGWFLIRYDASLLTSDDVPHRCDSLVPSTQAFACYFASYGGGVSGELTGAPNTFGNISYYGNVNCSGAGGPASKEAVVIANSAAEALAICTSMGGTYSDTYRSFGWNTPSNWHYCQNY